MTETVTFANFNMTQGNVHDIGKGPEYERSVAGDIALAFGGSEEQLGDLIGAVAPHKDLQENIAFAQETLSNPKVQEKLGYEPGTNPHQIGHDWAIRSGLQTAVFRPFMEPQNGGAAEHLVFDAAVIPDRVARWMKRMGDVAVDASLEENTDITELLIIPTETRITKKESILYAGRTRHDYAAREVVPDTGKRGTFGIVSLCRALPAEVKGRAVMVEAADLMDARHDLANPMTKILLPTAAGNWIQTGAQAREAFQGYAGSFDDDPDNRQLWVRSDVFETDPTGTKPPIEAQNSLSAIGNFLRSISYIKKLQQS